MKTYKNAIVLLVLVANLISPVIYAEEWPKLQNPPNSEVVWVGDDVIQNGVPMRMKKFKSELGIDDIISFYRNEWQGLAEFKPVEDEFQEWTIIGVQLGDYYMTVQVKNSDEAQSEGLIGVSKMPVMAAVDLNIDLPSLDGSSIISNTRSHDMGNSAETIVLKNSYSIQSNISFYKSEMDSDGWALSREDTRYVNGDSAKFLYFQKRKKSYLLTLSNSLNGDTVVVANKINY